MLFKSDSTSMQSAQNAQNFAQQNYLTINGSFNQGSNSHNNSFNSSTQNLNSSQNNSFYQANYNQKHNKDTNVLYVKNLAYTVEQDDLVEFLHAGAGIKNVKMMLDSKNRPNGDAYIEFETVEAADHAMELDGNIFKDRKLMLFRSNAEIMNSAEDGQVQTAHGQSWDGTVRLYGWTYDTDENTVRSFLSGLKIHWTFLGNFGMSRCQKFRL